MKCEAKTEQEMRECSAPWPETTGELVEYIDSLTEREHDYGTCCYAMSLAAVAAFQYVANKLGVTGFQASCADLDVLRAMNEWTEWAGKEAAKKLEESPAAHPDVLRHGRHLSGLHERAMADAACKQEQPK